MSTTTHASAETAVATQVYRVYIKATPQAIWDAITKPEWNAKYGYPGRGEYDLRPGGKYLATADEQRRRWACPRSSSTARSSRWIRRGSSSRRGGRSGARSSSRKDPTRVTWEISEEATAASRS